jgi:hypothetical protein
MMSDDAEQVNPPSQIEPESKGSDSQRSGSAGKRLVTLLKAMTLFVAAGCCISPSDQYPIRSGS